MDNYDQIDLVLLDLTMPLMNGDDARYRHPAFWAPFVYVGAGR